MSALSTTGSAKVTESDVPGYYLITSQNLREIATVKAERDFYQLELYKLQKKKPVSIGIGISTQQGGYAQLNYHFELW